MKTESSGTTGQGKPTTADVQESLVNAANFKDFLLRNAQNMLAQTLPEYLSLQLRQKHLRRADVVRGSHLDRTYVYQIFSGKKTPSRVHIPDQTCQLHGEFPPGGRRKPATPPEGSASNGLCQP
jgi:hypothetical protein